MGNRRDARRPVHPETDEPRRLVLGSLADVDPRPDVDLPSLGQQVAPSSRWMRAAAAIAALGEESSEKKRSPSLETSRPPLAPMAARTTPWCSDSVRL